MRNEKVNLWHRIKIWGSIIKSLAFAFSGSKANILDMYKTVEVLKNEKRSLIRFGDGEFGIFEGKSIHYQEWSQELKSRFEEIKHTYEVQGNDCRFLLAVPYTFFKENALFILRKRVYISSWAQPRFYFKYRFRQNLVYGDAFIFAKPNEELYKHLWKDISKIIFIHNNIKYAKHFFNRYGKEVYFVKVPEQNAFEKLDIILSSIQDCISRNKLSKEDFCILVSAGPTGKIITFELSQIGFWCMDTGHCWDTPLEIDFGK